MLACAKRQTGKARSKKDVFVYQPCVYGKAVEGGFGGVKETRNEKKK